jgi:PAS domain S-box-containing protein
LYVDDDSSACDVVASSLEEADDRLTVETATGPDDGLALIGDRTPDCVVSAYEMAETDGVAFLRAVRDGHPDLPFIMYADDGSEVVAGDAVRAGVSDYLTRESGFDRLADRIGDVVESRRKGRQADRRDELMRLTEITGNLGGFEIDLDDGEVLTTDGVDRLLDLPEKEDLNLETAVELYHPEDRPAIREAMEGAVETGERTDGTFRYRPPNGEGKLLRVAFDSVTGNGDGRTLRGAICDVTARERRQRDLEQIETLFEHAQDSLFLVDASGAFTLERVNPAYEDATGLSGERICGRSLRDVFGDDGAAMETKYAECVDGREPLEYDERIELDGELTHWETRIAPVELDGTVEYVVGSTRNVTERRERRQELKRLRQAIDDANVAITLSDPSLEDDPLVYVNDEFEEMTGYPPEETLGRNCRFLQGEETDPDKLATLREAIDEEEAITVELCNYRRDGTEFLNRLTVTPIYDDDGRLVRYLGTQEDVTERKQRQEELEAERRFIEQAIDTLEDLFYVLDTDGTLRRWNDRVPEVTGYDESELEDVDAIDLFPEDERATIAGAIGSAVSGETVTVQSDLLTADGSRIPYEFTGTQLTDGEGNTTGMVGVGRDLTEARERERLFQALIEESSDVISIVGKDARFQYVSPSVERILGYAPEAVVGDTAWEYVHPEDRERVAEQFEDWVGDAGQTSPVVEYRTRHADGTWRWMESRGNNRTDDPAVEGVVINSRDVTERKERQQQLRVFDRVLRHNLRNDVSVIRGEAVEIHSEAGGEIADRAGRIVEMSDGLMRTAEEEREISTLLEKTPRRKTTTIEPLIQDVAARIRDDHPEATVTVDCPDGAEIRATRRFERAMEELLVNAVVHNDTPSPEVAVTVSQSEGTTRIEVADDGPPIPERERNVLTQPAERTPVNHTTGLGLWLVKLIVSRSGGTIAFEENPSGGNVVSIHLQE